MIPAVSVIIPVYNVEKYLAQCLDSVLTQDFEDIEIICVDDGSPDRSIDILLDYAARDSRVRIIRRENGGLSAARNTGLDSAKGKYVYFLDSDDMLAPNALVQLTERAERDALDVLYFDSQTIYESEEIRLKHGKLGDNSDRSGDYPGVMTGRGMFAAMMGHGDYCPQVPRQLFRRGFLEETGIRFYEGIIHEDELFTFLTALQAQRAGYMKAALFLRRVRDDSIMTRGYVHKNFKGYLIGYREMMRYAMAHTFEPEVDKAVWAHIVRRRDRAMRVYCALDEEQRRGVDWTDDPFTHALLAMSEREEVQHRKEQNIRLKKELDDKQRLLNNIRDELEAAKRFLPMRIFLKLRRMNMAARQPEEEKQ